MKNIHNFVTAGRALVVAARDALHGMRDADVWGEPADPTEIHCELLEQFPTEMKKIPHGTVAKLAELVDMLRILWKVLEAVEPESIRRLQKVTMQSSPEHVATMGRIYAKQTVSVVEVLDMLDAIMDAVQDDIDCVVRAPAIPVVETETVVVNTPVVTEEAKAPETAIAAQGDVIDMVTTDISFAV